MAKDRNRLIGIKINTAKPYKKWNQLAILALVYRISKKKKTLVALKLVLLYLTSPYEFKNIIQTIEN